MRYPSESASRKLRSPSRASGYSAFPPMSFVFVAVVIGWLAPATGFVKGDLFAGELTQESVSPECLWAGVDHCASRLAGWRGRGGLFAGNDRNASARFQDGVLYLVKTLEPVLVPSGREHVISAHAG